MPDLSQEFTHALRELHDRAKAECDLPLPGLLRLIDQHGGIGTARDLLARTGVSSAYRKLAARGRLDLAVEAVVLQERFRALFTPAELAVAATRVGERRPAGPANLFEAVVTHTEGDATVPSRDLAHLQKVLGASGKPEVVEAFLHGCVASGCRIKVVKQEVTVFQGGFSGFYARGNRGKGTLDLHFHERDPRFARLRTAFPTEELVRGYWGVNLASAEEVGSCFAELAPRTATVPGAPSQQHAPHCLYHIMSATRLADYLGEGGRGTFRESQSWRAAHDHWREAGDATYLIFFDHADEFVGVGWVARVEAIDVQRVDTGKFETRVRFSGLRRLPARFDKTHLRLASDGRHVDAAYLRGYLPCQTPDDVEELLAGTAAASIWDDGGEAAASFVEGGLVLHSHLSRERDRQLVDLAKAQWSQRPRGLACDVCDFDFAQRYGALGAGFIEAHHRKPIAELKGPTATTIDDLAPVCANCHRMLHRETNLTVEQLRGRLTPAGHAAPH